MIGVAVVLLLATEASEENPLVPYLPFLGIVAGVVGTGVFSLVRDKWGNSASKAPTIGEIWKRMDKFESELRGERAARMTLRQVFLQYVNRVQSGGNNALTAEEHQQLFEEDDKPAPEPA